MESDRHRIHCFLSLPHEFDHLRKELVDLVEDMGGRAFYVTEPEGRRLRPEIKTKLFGSGILIADLSSAPETMGGKKKGGPRPAVMWEIGFAEALGMNAIYLVQGKDRNSNVPSIIAEEHLVEYELHKLDEAMKRIRRALDVIFTRESAPETSMFRANCYTDRRSCDLEVKYLTANNTVRILELNLDTVLAQASTIIKALQRNDNLSVQILTLNPFSDFAAARADQLAELPLAYSRQLLEDMQGTHSALSEIAPDRWEVRVYDTFPTQIMFQIDRAIFHSIISLGRKSRDMLHFEVQGTHPNAETSFEAHFRTLWNRSTEYGRWLQQNEARVSKLLGSEESSSGQDTRPAKQRRKFKPEKHAVNLPKAPPLPKHPPRAATHAVSRTISGKARKRS